jgi:O-antigen/teichoic acid export membrane protein
LTLSRASTLSRPLARAVAVSTSTQLAARGVDLLVNAITSIAVLRYLGPAGFGDFILVVTITGLTGLLADLGLPKVAVRRVAQEPSTAGPVIGTVTLMRLILCFGSLAVGQGVLTVMGAAADVHLAALVATTTVIAESLLSVTVVFHVAVRQQNEAAVRLTANVVKLAVVALLVFAHAGLVALVAATNANLLIAAGLAWWVSAHSFGLRPSIDKTLVPELLRDVLPVAPIMLVGVIYLKLGTLMVALLAARSALGIYGAAYQPIEYLFLASAVIVGVLFPLAARAHARDTLQFISIYQLGIDVLVAVILPASVILVMFGRPICRLLYGSGFGGAATPVMVLGAALVPMAVNAWQGFVLVAAGKASVAVRYLLLAVAVQGLADAVLVPAAGVVGAAWGVLGSSILLVVMSTAAVYHAERAPLAAGRLVQVCSANGLLTGVLVILTVLGLAWLPTLAIGSLTYPLLLVLCRVTAIRDVRSIFRSPQHGLAPAASEVTL